MHRLGSTACMLCAALLLGGSARAVSSGERSGLVRPGEVPRWARVLGIRVGVSTRNDIERRMGRGFALTGAHPQGARLWRLRGTSWLAHWDSDGSGDSVSIVRTPALLAYGRSIPTGRLGRSSLGPWRGLRYGMSKAAAARVLRRASMPAWTDQGAKWVWRKRAAKVTWSAECEFGRGKLTGVSISGER